MFFFIWHSRPYDPNVKPPSIADRLAALHNKPRLAIVLLCAITLAAVGWVFLAFRMPMQPALAGALSAAVLVGFWARRLLYDVQSSPQQILLQRLVLGIVPFVIGMSAVAAVMAPMGETMTTVIACYLGGGILALGSMKSINDERARSRA